MSRQRFPPILSGSIPLQLYLRREDALERLLCTGESSRRDRTQEPETVSETATETATKTVTVCGLPVDKDQQSVSHDDLEESIPEQETDDSIWNSAKACRGSIPSSCSRTEPDSSLSSSLPSSMSETLSEASSGPNELAEIIGGGQVPVRPPELAALGTDEVASRQIKPAPDAHPARLPLSMTHGERRLHVSGNAIDNLVYGAIRELLSEDRVFAEEVINAVKHLVGSGRGVVFLGTAGDSDGTNVPKAHPSSQPTAPDTAPSSTSIPASSLNESQKKRRQPPDDPEDPDRPRTKAVKHDDGKRALRWPCPYILAFDLMPCDNSRFLPCRLPSGLRKRDDLKGPVPGEDDQYLMSETQWEDCQRVFDAHKALRPEEQSPEWYKSQTGFYHSIWRVLFPVESFHTTSMEPPSRPFDITPPQFRPPLDQVKILFCALQHVDATRSVGPNIKLNLERAFAIVAKFSGDETREYLRTVQNPCAAAAVHDPSQWMGDDALENTLTSSASVLEPAQKPVISMEGLVSDTDSAIWFVQGLPYHPNVRPDHKLYITVLPVDRSSPRSGLLTSTITCGENHGNMAALGPTMSPNALLAMPLMDPPEPFSPIHKVEWIIDPGSPSMNAFENYTYEGDHPVEEVCQVTEDVLANLETDGWFDNNQHVSDSHHTQGSHISSAVGYLDTIVEES